MQSDREYQRVAIENVRVHWDSGARSVLLVAPTGAGKTHLGTRLVGDNRALWVAHRRELVRQATTRLAAEFGARNVGAIMPGEPTNALARIQVGTVQTLLARGAPDADLLVLDEAHHYAAEEWRQLAEQYARARTLGLTATPERQDGEPLGDVFDELVVAASYSELIRDGHLVDARVYQPPKYLKSDLAQDPVDAWVKYSEGSQAFIFCARVGYAYEVAERLRALGVIAETIECFTATRERDRILERFAAGKTRVITNVGTMTEGVDVPVARTAILARQFGHVGGMIQCTGRVLRPFPGKGDAIVVDLTGATIRHGLPTKDRVYSLEGRPISGEGHGGGAGPSDFKQSVLGLEMRVVAPGKMTAESKPVAVDTEYRRKLLQKLETGQVPRAFARMKRLEVYR